MLLRNTKRLQLGSEGPSPLKKGKFKFYLSKKVLLLLLLLLPHNLSGSEGFFQKQVGSINQGLSQEVKKKNV